MPYPQVVQVKEWTSNYVPRFYMDVITYACRNPNDGLTIFC